MTSSYKRPPPSSEASSQQQQRTPQQQPTKHHDSSATDEATTERLTNNNHNNKRLRGLAPSLFLSSSPCSSGNGLPMIRRLKVPNTEEELDGLLDDAYSVIQAEEPKKHQQEHHSMGEHQLLSSWFIMHGFPRIPRPLPASHILATAVVAKQPPGGSNNNSLMDESTIATSTRSNLIAKMPLLQDFFRSIGKEFPCQSSLQSQQEEATTGNNKGNRDATTVLLLDDIDNPKLSVMTAGHHDRYLRLTRDYRNHHHHHHWKDAQKKELQRLQLLVQTERARYRQALLEFIQRHKKRYCLGFVPQQQPIASSTSSSLATAQDFSTIVSRQVELFRQAWEHGARSNETNPPPMYYQNHCCQRITIRRKSGEQRQQQVLLDSVECKVVHISSSTTDGSNPNKETTLNLEEILQACPIGLSKPDLHKIPPIQLLRHDTKAAELCRQYQATILTTVEALVTLLHLPADASIPFRVPVVTLSLDNAVAAATNNNNNLKRPPSHGRSNNKFIVHCLDIPIPQPCTSPRECLTRGYQEGLYQHFDDGSNQSPSPYVYTLWTLPSAISKSPALRILVRSTDRLSLTTTEEDVSVIPIIFQASLEYFTNSTDKINNSKPSSFRPRSWELPTSWEKARWILHQKMSQHRSGRVHVARIDPATATVVALEEKSIAHSLAGEQPKDVVGVVPPLRFQTTEQALVEQQQQQQLQHQQDGSSSLLSLPVDEDVNDDPLVHWQALLDILQSISTLRQGDHVLCFPPFHNSSSETFTTTTAATKASPFTITLSVHAAAAVKDDDAVAVDNDAASWHVPSWLEQQADRVYLSDAAVRQSFRNWKWERPDRVPYTFPCP